MKKESLEIRVESYSSIRKEYINNKNKLTITKEQKLNKGDFSWFLTRLQC